MPDPTTFTPSIPTLAEQKMETLGPFKGIYRVTWGLYRDNGNENGNPRSF